MKTTLIAMMGLASTCLLAQTPGTIMVAPTKPQIAVPIFQNKTGGSVSRVAAGQYTEKRGSGSSDVPTGQPVSSDTGNWNDVPERKIEAVPSSGLRLPEAATEIATNAVKEALTNSGKFTVVDYSPLVEMEIDSKRTKEHVDGYRVSANSGIEYLLVGSINNYRVRNEKSVVYGVRHWRNTVTVSMDMKLLRASTQEVIASKTMSEKLTRDIPQGVTEMEGLNDDWEEPLRMAIESAVPKFIASINVEGSTGTMTPAAPTVDFEVNSTPDGADVEYNNSFVGNTPCTVKAPAAPGILRVSLAGYEPWEKRVTPSAGMRISPKLQKVEKPVIVQPQQPVPAPAPVQQ